MRRSYAWISFPKPAEGNSTGGAKKETSEGIMAVDDPFFLRLFEELHILPVFI